MSFFKLLSYLLMLVHQKHVKIAFLFPFRGFGKQSLQCTGKLCFVCNFEIPYNLWLKWLNLVAFKTKHSFSSSNE